MTWPIASCFGGGGAFGVAFNFGVAAALADSGLPLADGPMLGSSAGTWTAAALATGNTFEDVMSTWEGQQMARPVKVIEIARSLLGDRMDARVTGVAVELPLMLRVTLNGARHPLADIVAASSSPPPMARPHRIGVHHYMDHMARYSSADLSPPARLHVVLTPLGGRVLGRLGWAAERTARYEMGRWRRRHHGVLLFVRPNQAIAGLCDNIDSLFSIEVGRATYPLAYELGLRSMARFKAHHPELAAELARPRSAAAGG